MEFQGMWVIVEFILVVWLLALQKRINHLEQTLKNMSDLHNKQATSAQPEPRQNPVQKIDLTNEPEDIAPAITKEQISLDAEFQFNDLDYSFKKENIVPPSATTEHALVTTFKNYILSGNPIAKIGVIILFIGVTFLFRYAILHNFLSIEIRLLCTTVLGMSLIAIGCHLNSTRKTYATILVGGGAGILYLTIFAAYYFYEILPSSLAFILLAMIVAATGILAVWQDAKFTALFGVIGGFLAPILISSGENHYVVLFSYYLLLNIGILAIAYLKSWPVLNLTGFIFTFVISGLWGYQSYQPEYLFPVEAFLMLFFILYTAMSLLNAFNTQGKLSTIDNLLGFAVPIIGFSLQASIVNQYTHALAYSALGFCIFYAMLSFLIQIYSITFLKYLQKIFIGFAILFATITIPLLFSQQLTVSVWAMESIVLLWIGIKNQQPLIRLAASVILLVNTIQLFYGATPLHYVASLLHALSNLTAAYLFYQFAQDKKEENFALGMAKITFVVGWVGWYLFNLIKISHTFPYQQMNLLLFLANTSLVFFLIGEYLKWPWLRMAAFGLIPILIFYFFPIYPVIYYVMGSLLCFIYTFAVLYTLLYRTDRYVTRHLNALHCLSYLLLTWILTHEAASILNLVINFSILTHYLLLGLVPSMMLYLICYGDRVAAWPFKRYRVIYQQQIGQVLSWYMFFWFLGTTILSGQPSAFPYLPIINLLDLTILIGLGSILCWFDVNWLWLIEQKKSDVSAFPAICGILIFIWLTSMLLRTIAYWLPIAYDLSILWDSTFVQAAVSLFWTLLALIITFFSTRLKKRYWWFLGFSLIWIVILKLLVIDLSSSNTLSRVVSFIGVGLLLLINSFLSPVPPKNK